MIIELITLIIGGTALLIIAVLILRKFPKIAAIDVSSMPKKKHEELKLSLIENRLTRKFSKLGRVIEFLLNPLWDRVKGGFKKIFDYTLRLERKYKNGKIKPQTMEEKETARKKAITLIAEGEELVKKENYTEAEKKFIEVISLDSKSVEAYQHLGEVYQSMKEWEQARDTFEFILKSNPKDHESCFELGEIHQAMDDQETAVEYYKKAIDLSPNSPKYLDCLLDLSIAMKNKILARDILKKLEEANPENQKLIDFRKKIEEL